MSTRLQAAGVLPTPMLRSLRSFSNLGQTKNTCSAFSLSDAEWAVRVTFMLRPIQVVFKATMACQQLR